MLKLSSSAGVSLLGFPYIAQGGKKFSPNDRVNIAFIGVSGIHNKKAAGKGIIKEHNIVAYADVDEKLAEPNRTANPKVPFFRDFRVMFDKMGKKIDAVMIGTPDHTHFSAMLGAIENKSHVFCQKPLTHNLWENAEIKKLAKQSGLITQMGNQGHGFNVLRMGVEWIKKGVIGDVTEVHMWTNRSGNAENEFPSGESIPSHLAWDVWLSGTPKREYSSSLHPKRWRWWKQFGTGPLGDIGCHTMDLPKWALDLSVPEKVYAETSGTYKEGTPKSCIVTYEFGKREKLPPVKLVWYDGGKKPPKPKDMEKDRELPKNGGAIFYGTKHSMYVPGMRPGSLQVLPYAKLQELKRTGKLPEPWLPRLEDGIDGEWLKGIQTGKQPSSNFVDYACNLTDLVHLGNLAIRSGKTIQWDRKKLKDKKLKGIDQLIKPERNYSFGKS